jgi:hypothetical protein
MRERDYPHHPSVSKVWIYPNNQNMIVVIAVRLSIDDDFLSRSEHCAHLDYVNERGDFDDPNYVQSEFPFLYDGIKIWQKPSA